MSTRLGRAVSRLLGAFCLVLPALLSARPALPPEVAQALQRARVPEEALSVVIEEAGTGRSVLAWQEDRPVNPASLMKLVTTYAALDRFGPAWSWRTPVWLLGEVRDGVLEGSLVIRGSGDPTLVLERVWLMLRRVQQLGVREIRGDIVIDSSAFELPDGNPGDFDGEALRPYNTRPDALLLNFKTVTFGFVPDAATGRARVTQTPALAGAEVDRSVPLLPGPCSDWRTGLKAQFNPDGSTRFTGGFPTACGELAWPVADPQPRSYNARLLEGLWREMGGQLTGRVREAAAPLDRAPNFELVSPALAEVVRDINKHSNNVMAQHLFLTLGLEPTAPAAPAATPAATLAATPGAVSGTPGRSTNLERARAAVMRWLDARAGAGAAGVVLGNGAGLSREGRIPAALMARLLQQAWSSPVMPELMSSLPVSGLDGTLRRAQMQAGRAHLKTGSLRDVSGLAGYVLSDSGRRYVLVAIVNHANAAAARPALDALVRWALNDAPTR
jgi:D-alanyl-D-alanine carboxypeptidase/D-alanyl-D-alanine-endopeptidase (penicillin-binding protein 4)